jgi:hypothetical protein
MLSRMIRRAIFNFGFSGNCLMEVSVAQYLCATVPPPGLFVIDCSHNMNASLIADRAVPLVQYVRTLLPSVPIVLAEGTPFGRNWLVAAADASQAAANLALWTSYQELRRHGVDQLFYVNSSDLFTGPNRLDSPTAMGLHPSDTGMYNVARFWAGFLANLPN